MLNFLGMSTEPRHQMVNVALELEDLNEDFYVELEEESTRQSILDGKHYELMDRLLWVSGRRTSDIEESEKLLASFLYDQYTEALGKQSVILLSLKKGSPA